MAYNWLNANQYPQYGGGYSTPNYGGNVLPWQVDDSMHADYPQESALSSLVRGIPSVAYSFQGRDLGPMHDIASQMGNLSNAMYDQNNPVFQQIYGQEKGAAQQDLAAVIAEAVRQNRKQATLGRTPLFDPERGGETQFRALTQGYADVQEKARNRARDIIGVAQQGLGRAYDAQNSLSQAKLQNKAMKSSGFNTIAGILPSLLKMF